MKANRILLAAALAALTLLGTGCKKHSWRPEAGTPIKFKVTSDAAPQNATKTAYSGQVSDSFERIDWIRNDKMAIFMGYFPEEYYGFRDYVVSDDPTADGRKSQAPVSAVNGGLEWQGDGLYMFCGIYPSPSVFPSDFGNEFNLYRVIVNYPKNQVLTPKGESGADALTLLPDMKYAYLFAGPFLYDNPTGTITLSFRPVFTAFQISISAGDNDDIHLRQFRLLSNIEDEPLSLKKNLYHDDEHPYEPEDESQEIIVDFPGEDGIHLERDGAPLVLTVFAAGYDVSYNALTLEFTGDEIGTRTLDLKENGNWIGFAGDTKHCISGLYFPALDDGSAGGQGINWGGMYGEELGWYGAEGEDINWRRD